MYLVEKYEDLRELRQNLGKEEELNKITDKDYRKCYYLTLLAIEKLRFHQIKALPYFSDEFPKCLEKVRNTPPVLYVKGNLDLSKKMVAVVGSRKISDYGKNKTINITTESLKLSLGVVSGLALGVDSIAHETTVRLGGYTIAVMPNSLDSIYPRENFKIANDILESGGALVSEMIFGINRGKKSFVQRNRIQAGLSDIIIPTEMRVESGTMHTINFALSQDKWLCLPDFTGDSLEDNGIKHLVSKFRNQQNGKKVMVVKDLDEFYSRVKQLSLNNGQLTLF